MSNNHPNLELLSIKQTAALLNISERTLHRMVNNKAIKHVRIGHRKLGCGLNWPITEWQKYEPLRGNLH